jgi:predicted metal-binding transcription factor (methanogenesis marker protein 9)
MSELEFKKHGFSEEAFMLIRETVAKNAFLGFITGTCFSLQTS